MFWDCLVGGNSNQKQNDRRLSALKLRRNESGSKIHSASMASLGPIYIGVTGMGTNLFQIFLSAKRLMQSMVDDWTGVSLIIRRFSLASLDSYRTSWRNANIRHHRFATLQLNFTTATFCASWRQRKQHKILLLRFWIKLSTWSTDAWGAARCFKSVPSSVSRHAFSQSLNRNAFTQHK